MKVGKGKERGKRKANGDEGRLTTSRLTSPKFVRNKRNGCHSLHEGMLLNGVACFPALPWDN